MYTNSQAVFASVAMAVPKGGSFRLVGGYRVVNHQLEAVPWAHPNLAQAVEFLTGPSSCFATLDLLQDSWQMPMDENGEEAIRVVVIRAR